ncbi:MAG TPA: acetyl-coenzyme A synthetase N-terminal domain-containing protein, partial [Symbiobacteriaceae bacterium]|nr:acetyl-coenzyme A synthetase N-terminal domain-containing protein [Symbiobacteriaceae bacterium]
MVCIIWTPTAEVAAKARITAFLHRCRVRDLEALHARTREDPGWFWSHVADDLGIAWYETPKAALDLSDGIA